MCWYNFPNLWIEISNTLRTMINSFDFWNIKICLISKIILDLMPSCEYFIHDSRVLRFLSRIKTELSISSNSSEENIFSLYIKRRHLSWSLFILFFVQLWNIQTNWQQLNWDMKNAFNNNTSYLNPYMVLSQLKRSI